MEIEVRGVLVSCGMSVGGGRISWRLVVELDEGRGMSRLYIYTPLGMNETM